MALGVAHGPWFWVHIVYSYLLTFLGTFLVFLAMLRAPGLYRQQGWALLLGILLPWVGNAIFVSGFSSLPTLDLTPSAFTLSALIFGWAVFRFQLLDLLANRHEVRDCIIAITRSSQYVIAAEGPKCDATLLRLSVVRSSSSPLA